MTEQKIRRLKRKLQESRCRLLTGATELAVPLVDMLFIATKDVRRMSTNGACIYFDPAWLEKLCDRSLDFELCHQLMHIELGHLQRKKLYRGDRYHFACNVVANSHLVSYGFTEEKLPGIGEIHRKTYYPCVEGRTVTAAEAFKMIPLDPASLNDAQRRNLLLDSDEWWDRTSDRGEKGVVVLSPKDPDPDDLIPSERMTGEIEYYQKKRKKQKIPEIYEIEEKKTDDDDWSHFRADYIQGPEPSLKESVERLRGIKEREERENGSDGLIERVIRDVPIIPNDWRTLLNHFIMDETRDYDFTPPDKRIQELEFFLPDFDESQTPRLKVLFMVDVSASLTNAEVSMAAMEIRAAMEQFCGMLQGYIGFFDTKVRRVIEITDEQSMLSAFPTSGGGTDFGCIFRYLKRKMADDPPSEIVIMTDGKDDFPDYAATMGIPVLWLLTNNRVRIPWGQAAYFRK